ncbi:hypothetical protein IB211_02701 [Intestinimonas butyriciproducens]|uniref:Uncharacterized protein n=1 Tax=Intestinimonas butyriciproducens TaxID=1297617 RepID=A0A0S2W6W3_9FIRM|nr:hypothetical protein IB211_02701 [Intestinimonas butyriciproducens]
MEAELQHKKHEFAQNFLAFSERNGKNLTIQFYSSSLPALVL